MDWFSRHTNWLYSETTELSNNSIYKENYQFIDKILISTGNVLVHKSETKYYPILISYPEATPYVPPIIFILKEQLSESISREYSTLSLGEISKHVKEKIKYFNRRHQNEDGSVCFVETGDLHSENAEKYTIKDIIKRLRIWLSGTTPKDSGEVELFHHFKNRTYEIQYLLPDSFFDTEMVKGKYFAGLSRLIASNILPDVIEKKTYMGVTIYGENEAGITLSPKINKNEKLTLFAPIPDIEKLIIHEKKEEKVKKIADKNLIEGYWWDILKEPEPFSLINELARYIGNNDEGKGIETLIESLNDPLLQIDEMIHIGIRFPGRWREKDWQMFRLKRGNRIQIPSKDKAELKERLLDYSIEAVYQEYLTDEYFHLRNKGRADRHVLKNTNISVIGCGALGSETADALNKSGIGTILLVDRNVMKAHNAIRHCLGIDNMSFPKVLGMTKHLFMHNPFVNIKVPKDLNLNILNNKLEDYLPEGTIGISTIADDNIEAYLNEQAISEDRTIFYCRALRGGKVARMFRVIPHNDACKTCLSIYSKENNSSFINIEEDEELPVITNECNNPVRPASAADLKIIAGIFSRVFIDYLQEINIDKNHWIWSTESLEQLKLVNSSHGNIYADTILPHPNCPTCQKLEDKKVYISKETHEFIKQESAHSGDNETGGVLIGYRTTDGKYVILKATGPGEKAIRTKTRFEKDEQHCQAKLENALRELGDKGLYLGEWHYHPAGSNEPSGLDIKSLTEIAAQNNYRIDKPVMIILSPSLECAITIHDKNEQCIKLPLEICETLENL